MLDKMKNLICTATDRFRNIFQIWNADYELLWFLHQITEVHQLRKHPVDIKEMEYVNDPAEMIGTLNSTILPSYQDRSRNSERDLEILNLHNISNNIRISYIWVIFAFGFPGNFFSVVTVLTMQNMTPATLLISFLALCDGCALTVKLIGHQMVIHHVYFGDIGCKFMFFPLFLSMLANWILVLICAERFVSVCFPLTRYLIFTKRRTYLCTSVLTIILLVSIGSVYCIMRAADPSGLECGTEDTYYSFWVNGWYWINIMFNLFIPLVIIVILTGLIIRGLYKSRLQRRNMLVNGKENSNNNLRLVAETERMERTITGMLILAAAVFLFLSLPTCVYILAAPVKADSLTKARWEVFDQVQYLLIDSTHAVNFFLYFFSLKRFRSQFVYILTCKLRARTRRNNRGNETNVSIYSTRYTLTKSDEDVSHL